MMKKVIITFSLMVFSIVSTYAQCAMCRATIENNVSNGDVGIGASLNFGIMYLFFAPYLLIGTVAYLWYRNSRANANKEQGKRHFSW